MKTIATIAAVLALSAAGIASAQPMRRVPASEIVPFYSPDQGAVEVPSFEIDAVQVTNGRMLAFVRRHAEWRRSEVRSLFADDRYLAHWEGDLELGEAGRDRPVVNVSWFAARAYCESRGARLPTELEWEIAARADETRIDASGDPELTARILAWYSRPPRELRDVGASPANVLGIHDLHGLVWEWVDDFNASMVSADDRARMEDVSSRFCGAGALASASSTDYATFMRYAFRSSLRPSYAIQNLGFRCARSVE